MYLLPFVDNPERAEASGLSPGYALKFLGVDNILDKLALCARSGRHADMWIAWMEQV